MIKIIGKRIKTLREERDWSQTLFAKKVGVSQPTMSDIESGANNPSFPTLINIADVFGISVDELVRGQESDCKQEVI